MFNADGEVVEYTVATGESDGYAVQNVLAEGYVFDITVEDGAVTAAEPSVAAAHGKIAEIKSGAITVNGQEISVSGDGVKIYKISSAAGGAEVTAGTVDDLAVGKTVKVYENDNQTFIYLTFVAEPYEPPVGYTPGLRTLKNFLAAAMQPVGTALYVYGGGWDWQDVGSSNQAKTIGTPQTWIDFFQGQDENYTYKNSDDPAHSYYPHNSWNQYYFAGVDCSGYVGWAIYNTMNAESGNDGYVMSSTKMAKTFGENGWGVWTQDIAGPEAFSAGDVFSMNGHVWICVGVCDDGSLVILHSTPSDSKVGKSGGGVQLSGVGESEDCEAVALAKEYMTKYFPAWSERYDAVFKKYESYTKFTGSNAGKFGWTIGGTLSDPDGYADMTAGEILADLFAGANVASGDESSPTPTPQPEPEPTSDGEEIKATSAVINEKDKSVTFDANGQTTLTLTVTPANANEKLTWTSGDDGVVTITPVDNELKAILAAIGDGTTVITVKNSAGKVLDRVIVTVTGAAAGTPTAKISSYSGGGGGCSVGALGMLALLAAAPLALRKKK